MDANGFIKSASPVVKLFADKIEPNDEAAEQPLSFEKLGMVIILSKVHQVLRMKAGGLKFLPTLTAIRFVQLNIKL